MPTGSNFILGKLNTASDPTELQVPLGTPTGLLVRYPGGLGIVGAQSLTSGVFGVGLRGVSGISLNDVGIGVAGLGLKIGVVGDSFGARSVGSRGNADYLGVVGTTSPVINSKLVAGVHGETSNDMGIAVDGESASCFGVRGVAGRVRGSIGSVGVFGIGMNSGHGVIGSAAAPGFAGAFFGDVSVDGSFVVSGAKAAAVPFPDGSRRLLYSVESPESWFEDFGTARLVRGRATVRLDRGFGAVVRGAYHVFLSPEGDCRGLYVGRKSSRAFEVHEMQGGRATIRFSYRVVARRKDVAAPRFAKVKLPKVPKGADTPIQTPEAPRPLTPAEVQARVLTRSRRGPLRRARRR